MTAVHREESISLYRSYDNRGQLISVKDTQGRETQYEYNAAGDPTAIIAPDGNRSEYTVRCVGKGRQHRTGWADAQHGSTTQRDVSSA